MYWLMFAGCAQGVARLLGGKVAFARLASLLALVPWSALLLGGRRQRAQSGFGPREDPASQVHHVLGFEILVDPARQRLSERVVADGGQESA